VAYSLFDDLSNLFSRWFGRGPAERVEGSNAEQRHLPANHSGGNGDTLVGDTLVTQTIGVHRESSHRHRVDAPARGDST
jgi:hypothetical protein